MKRLYISITLLLGFLVGFSQTLPVQSIGGTNNIVVPRGYIGADTAYVHRTNWPDTTTANLSSYLKYQRGAVIRVGNTLWMRSQDLTKWISTGTGSVFTESSQSIDMSGDGSEDDPVTGNVILSLQEGNAARILGDGIYVADQVQNGLISGGIITWVSGYTYDVSPAEYNIGGVGYNSVYEQITLSNADPSLDRIDLVVVDINEDVVVIEGTPSADPQQPSYDATTQLPLSFILVTAGSTQPTPTPNSDYIYLNNAEWTTTSSTARINAASTNNPYSPTLDVEGTLTQNGDFISFAAPVEPTLSDYNVLTFFIQSKALWPNASSLILRFYNNGIAVGLPVYLSNTSFGFYSGQTSSYQIVTTLLSSFGPLTTVDEFRITVSTSGVNYLGFYIDNIQLQEADIPTVGYTANNGIELNGNTFQLGGPLIKNTTITSNNYYLSLSGSLASPTALFGVTNTGTGSGVSAVVVSGTAIGGIATSGRAVSGTSSSSYGVIGISTTGHAGGFLNTATSGSSAPTTLSIQRSTTGTPSAGYGASLDFIFSGTGSPSAANLTSNRIISTWTDATTATRTSKLVFTGVNSAVQADLITLSGNGALQINKYGVGSFTSGTPAYGLAVTATGQVIESPVGGGISAITADNGLTANTSTNVRWGGSLLANTTITGGAFNSTINSTGSDYALKVDNTVGSGLRVQGTTYGIFTTSSNGTAIGAYATNQPAFDFRTTKTSTNTVENYGSLFRNTTGTPANGIGGRLVFNLHSSIGPTMSNEIVSKLTEVTYATLVSEFSIRGVSVGVVNDLLTLNGNGAGRLNKYGIGTFTGTAAYTLQVDASGNIIEGAVGGGTYTASNGLTMTANNTVLGGTLTGATTINTGGFLTLFTGSNTTGVFNITNSGTGNAGVFQDVGSSATVDILKNNSNTNSDRPILSLERFTSGTAANGIAGTIDLYLESDAGSSTIANQILWKYTTAADATRTSQMIFSGVNSAVSNDILTLNGNGSIKFNDYGINTFAGVAAYVLGVDASGNVVEVAAAGAGMTNVLTTTGDIIYSSSGTTPARLGIGTTGQILAVSAGGIPEWITASGTGTVTSVAQSFTGGLISVSGSPITAAGTLALTVAGTSGGGVYFSSASTWASTGELAANAIMIGGGAGAAYSTTTTGTGVLTALGVNVGSAGAFVTFNGALGTPSSGVATNLTGTATSLNIGGNAATATILQTARTINGTSFDGSTNITVTAAAGTLTGTTLNATVVTSSLTSVGTIGTGVWQGTAIGDTYISSASTWNAKQAGDATLTALAGLTITNGSIIYGTGADAFSVLAAGTNGQVLTLAGGVPTWAAAGSGTVTSVAMSVPSFLSVSGSPITGAGTFAVTLSGTALPIANGGTGLTSDGAANEILGVEADGSGLEYKAISASNGISITHSVGGIAISNTFNPAFQTLTDGATITWNVTNGGNAVVTLASTGRTLSITNPVIGYTYTVRIIQGSGGSKTITTWPTNTKWPNGTAITLSTTAGDYDVVNFLWDGTNYYATYQNDFN